MHNIHTCRHTHTDTIHQIEINCIVIHLFTSEVMDSQVDSETLNCVCIFMFICIYLCMYVYMYVYVDVYLYVYAYMYIFIYVYVYMNVCIFYVCIYTYIFYLLCSGLFFCCWHCCCCSCLVTLNMTSSLPPLSLDTPDTRRNIWCP